MSVLVGIGGGSGSGKTTLARLIQSTAEPGEVAVLSIDSFYHSLPPGHLPESINYDHPSSLDFEALQACLDSIERREHVHIPVYDFATHTRVGHKKHPWASLVVVEGILALSHHEVRSRMQLAIYVSAPEPVRFRRRLDRDTRQRGRTEMSVREQWAKTVLPMHHQFVAPTEAKADLVVDGTNPFDRAVAGILDQLRRL